MHQKRAADDGLSPLQNRIGGAPVSLTAAEACVLRALLQGRGQPMSRDAVSLAALEAGQHVDPRMVDIHIVRLRRKLAACGSADLIETAWGRGYMVARDHAEAVPREGGAGGRAFQRQVCA